jgi:hypothetical protein
VPPAAAASTPPTPPPTAPPVPEAPAAVLQTSANIGELETRARRLIDEAVRDLSFVPQKELSAGAKDQFASAQRFVRLAREAVTSKNYLYAKELADKAAKLAKLLLKR